MRILVLDGLLNEDAGGEQICRIAHDELRAKGWEVDPVTLREVEVDYCRGCFKCWTKTPGVCVIDDAMRDIAKRSIQSDVILAITPVTYGGYSSELKKAMDRMIPILLPFFMKIDGEIHHELRYEKRISLLVVGILNQPDEESEQVFKTLVGRNAINYHSPYWGAEVLLRDQKQDSVREGIRALLAKVG